VDYPHVLGFDFLKAGMRDQDLVIAGERERNAMVSCMFVFVVADPPVWVFTTAPEVSAIRPRMVPWKSCPSTDDASRPMARQKAAKLQEHLRWTEL
jgi:hypothetical protein